MATHINWNAPDKTSLLIEFEISLTWEDFYLAVQQAHAMIATVPHRVDIVIWDRVGIPQGQAFYQFRTAISKQPSNTGRIIIVPTKVHPLIEAFLKRLVIVMGQLFPNKGEVIVMSSLEEAQALLAQAAAQAR